MESYSFRVADNPGVGPSLTTSALLIRCTTNKFWLTRRLAIGSSGLAHPPSWIGRTPCPQCCRRRRVHGFSCLVSTIADMELGLNLRHRAESSAIVHHGQSA